MRITIIIIIIITYDAVKVHCDIGFDIIHFLIVFQKQRKKQLNDLACFYISFGNRFIFQSK